MQQQVRPIPEGFHSVTPLLTCAGAADALGFYARAFGAVELSRMPGPDGKLMHATLRIGDSVVMLTDEFPEHGGLGPLALKGTPVELHLYVADADAVFRQALAAGAQALMPPMDMFWGDRYAKVQDPFGHRWSIATQQRLVTPEQAREEMLEAMAQGQGCGEQQVATQGAPQ